MKERSPVEPPRWAIRFLEWFCDDQQIEIFKGDLYEIFHDRIESRGLFWARVLFVFDVLDLFRPFAFKRNTKTQNRAAMFKNYFKVTYRNFLRQRVYSLINVSGLAVGLACSLLIYLYVQDELSYDSMHSKAERTYRIPEIFEKDGVGERSASNPFALGPAIIKEYPHLIEQMVRFFNFQTPVLALKNEENDREFYEQRLFLVDSTLFEVFDFELIVGNKETALDRPNTILLTETLAKKYFGEENPLGKTLLFQGQERLVVNGILKDLPTNLHFQFDGLISFSTVRSFLSPATLGRFYWNPCWTYLTLHDNNLRADLEDQFPIFVKKYFPDTKNDYVTLFLQPLLDIHLTSQLDYEVRANGNKNNVFIFSTVALFVLLIASINFINLSTARATKRAKEVGVRKALGSKKSQLINQFIFESVLYTTLAAVIAVGIVLLVLPSFNAFSGKAISLLQVFNFTRLSAAVGLILLVGLLSGLYPAFVLSSFDPLRVLKSSQVRSRGFNFRKVLVTLQFVVSILLIVGSLVVIQQLNLLQDDNLGFDREQVIMVTAATAPIGDKFETVRQELMRHPNIQEVSAVEEIVGAKSQVGIYQFDGMDDARPFPRLMVRHDFFKTFGMELAAGRSFSREFPADDQLALVVNESLVRSMGWPSNEEAVGTSFKTGGDQDGRIVGVVKDFNYASKHMPIAPLIMDLDTRPRAFQLFIKYMAIRVTGDNMNEVLAAIEENWRSFVPDRPFEYFFLDNKLAQSYSDEMKLSRLTNIFSGLAILVACLGLFGLATFTVEQRKKEIGIRKVLGIKALDIVSLLSRDFLSLIGIAFLVTLPLSYYLLNLWLDEFAYRIVISWMPYVIAGFSIFMVAFLTVSYHAAKAIQINPVTTLKDE